MRSYSFPRCLAGEGRVELPMYRLPYSLVFSASPGYGLIAQRVVRLPFSLLSNFAGLRPRCTAALPALRVNYSMSFVACSPICQCALVLVGSAGVEPAAPRFHVGSPRLPKCRRACNSGGCGKFDCDYLSRFAALLPPDCPLLGLTRFSFQQ